MCAARRSCCQTSKGARPRVPWASCAPQAYPEGRGRQPSCPAGLRSAERGAGASQAAEDRERVARNRLPDELAARLDLAVETGHEGLCRRFRSRADDQVAPPALDGVALLLEPVPELAGGAV